MDGKQLTEPEGEGEVRAGFDLRGIVNGDVWLEAREEIWGLGERAKPKLDYRDYTHVCASIVVDVA